MKIFKLTSALLVLGALTAYSQVLAQELTPENLGCTENLKTSILRQRAHDYCTSADADLGNLIDKNESRVNRQQDDYIKLEMKALNRVYAKDNPLLEAFKHVGLTGTNVAIENILDRHTLLGLGTLAININKGGNYLNTIARVADLQFAMKLGEKATVRTGDIASINTLQKTNRKDKNSVLVTVIKNAIGNNFSNLFNQIEYFTAEVDLNNDRTKEVIVYTAGPHCGAWECPVYIFKESGSAYRLIGKTGAASNEAQIAILNSRSNGWFNLATLIYDSQQRRFNWKLHKFNGSEYKSTFQNLTSTPSQIILRPNRGSGINLARSGIAIASLNHQELPPSLIAAIRQDFLKYRDSFSDYFRDSKDHRVFFVDLNNDHVNEAILYPAGGLIYSNRSCSIFIYTKVGNNYKNISVDETGRYSAVAGSRNSPSIGVLTTSNQGWRDLATRFFDYTTRTEKWSRVRYRSRGYTDSPLVLTSTPRTILEYSSGVETDFNKFLAP